MNLITDTYTASRLYLYIQTIKEAYTVSGKLCILRSNVKSVLLYVSEIWKEMKTTTSKLQTFVNSCLQTILNIHWPEVISNEELRRRTEEIEMSMQSKRWKWNWMGHTLRKGNEAIEREALDWNLQGKRRRGRTRNVAKNCPQWGIRKREELEWNYEDGRK